MAETKARAWKELIADLREHDAIAMTHGQYDDSMQLATLVAGFITQEFGTGKLVYPTRSEIRGAVKLARAYLKAAKGEG